MTTHEIFTVLGVLGALQEKQQQEQADHDRRMNNTNWRGV